MNSSDWEERVALHAGGDLPPAEAAEVERHLRECAACQVLASGLKQSLALLKEAHNEPLAPAHFSAVRARVVAELEQERRRGALWARRLGLEFWAGCRRGGFAGNAGAAAGADTGTSRARRGGESSAGCRCSRASGPSAAPSKSGAAGGAAQRARHPRPGALNSQVADRRPQCRHLLDCRQKTRRIIP